MRRELIEALNYPKSLVLEIIGEGDCPHDSLFEVTDKRCQQCDVSRECHWVLCLNDFADFEGKSTHTSQLIPLMHRCVTASISLKR